MTGASKRGTVTGRAETAVATVAPSSRIQAFQPNEVSTVEPASHTDEARAYFLLQAGERRGVRKAVEAVRKLGAVAELLQLKAIKEGKSYRGMQAPVEGVGVVTIRTWAEFCVNVEGRSVEAVDLDLLNLAKLGEEFVDAMLRMNVGPGQLRDMRRLPDDLRAELLAAAKAADPDAFGEVAKGLISKHGAEVKRLERTVADREVTLGAKDRTLAKREERIRELEEANYLRDSTSEGEQMELLRQDTQAAVNAIARLLGTVDRLLEVGPSPAVKLGASQAAEFLAQHLADTLLQRNITVNFEEKLTPIFLEDFNAIVDKGLAAQAERAAPKTAKKR